MTNDTKNSLTDFDMCLALAQKAINSQMKAAWDIWLERSESSNIEEMQNFALVSIFPLKKNGKPSKYGLKAELAPLTVSLYVPNAKLGQVEVTLHLQSGTVTYFDEEEEEKADYDIKDWSVSFLTDLDKQPCDLKTLERIDPNVRSSVQKVIEQSGLDDNSVFSIEYLFMKFTQVNLLLSDNKDIKIPDNVPRAARNKALDCLNQMLQGNSNEFMMGTVVRRSKTKSESPLPTFALTDFIFDVKADEVPEASTLSYLGMFERRPLPSNIDKARIALQDNWVSPEMLDGRKGSFAGVMAISKSRFVDEHILKAFKEILPQGTKEEAKPTKSTGKKYTLPPKKSKFTEKRILAIEYDFDNQTDLWLEVEIQKGSNKLEIKGRLDISTKSAAFPLGKISRDLNAATSWIVIEGYQNFNATIELECSGNSYNFELNKILKGPKIEDVVVTKDETYGLANLSKDELVKKILNEFLGVETYNQFVDKYHKEYKKIAQKAINNAFQKIDLNMSNQAFIPPGGEVFTFQNARFSDAGDLLFDVIYKAT